MSAPQLHRNCSKLPTIPEASSAMLSPTYIPEASSGCSAMPSPSPTSPTPNDAPLQMTPSPTPNDAPQWWDSQRLRDSLAVRQATSHMDWLFAEANRRGLVTQDQEPRDCPGCNGVNAMHAHLPRCDSLYWPGSSDGCKYCLWCWSWTIGAQYGVWPKVGKAPSDNQLWPWPSNARKRLKKRCASASCDDARRALRFDCLRDSTPP